MSFRGDGWHVPINFWPRGEDTIPIAPTVFMINTNLMVTLLPGNKQEK